MTDGGSFDLVLDDGRRLEGWAGAGTSAEAVLLHVGTPSAGVPFEPWVAATARRGLRFVTYSRPGYAGSARQTGRSVADCASDVAAIAGRSVWSACRSSAGRAAARMPSPARPCFPGSSDRLRRSPASLPGAAGLDWLDGMAEENRKEFGAALQGSAALEPFLEQRPRACASSAPTRSSTRSAGS